MEETRQVSPNAVTYQIVDGQVYRNSTPRCLFPARCKGVEHFLLRVATHLRGRHVEFVINNHDYPFVDR